jgi:hypothetical protein
MKNENTKKEKSKESHENGQIKGGSRRQPLSMPDEKEDENIIHQAVLLT